MNTEKNTPEQMLEKDEYGLYIHVENYINTKVDIEFNNAIDKFYESVSKPSEIETLIPEWVFVKLNNIIESIKYKRDRLGDYETINTISDELDEFNALMDKLSEHLKSKP